MTSLRLHGDLLNCKLGGFLWLDRRDGFTPT